MRAVSCVLDTMSTMFSVGTQLYQGCTFTPILFLIFMDMISRQQTRNIIFQVCYAFSCLEHLQRETARRHLNQMPAPLQQAFFHSQKQRLSVANVRPWFFTISSDLKEMVECFHCLKQGNSSILEYYYC